MYNSTQITNKINTLINGAVQAGHNRVALEALVADLKTAVTNFYTIDFTTYTEANIEMLTHALIRGGIVYKDFVLPSTTSTKPTGFDNVTDLFTIGTSIMTTTQTAFNNSIVVTDATDGGTVAYTSTKVEGWLNEWLNAMTTVPANLQLIAEYASEYALISGVKVLYEAPEIVSVPKTADIADDIYINRGYKELINKLSLSVYVPSYI